MDRQSIIGLLLIGAILVLYAIFAGPSKEEKLELQRKQDSIAKIERRNDSLAALQKSRQDSLEITDSLSGVEAPEANASSPAANADSLDAQKMQEKYGVMANAATGDSRIVSLENDKMIAKFQTRGGKLYSVELKGYETHDYQPLILFEGDTTVHFGFELFVDNRPLSTNDMYFEYLGSDTLIEAGERPATAVFRLKASENQFIEYTYSLKKGAYMLDYNVRLKNMHEIIAQNINYFNLRWEALIPGLEKGRKWESQNTTINYKYKEGDVEQLKPRSDEDEEETTGQITWVAYKQQFFSSILINEQGFDDPYFHFKSVENENSPYLKFFETEMSVPYKHEADVTYPMRFYFGPNKYSLLKDYDMDMEELIPLGWGIFGWFNKFLIIPLFNFLGKSIANYGIIILLLTIIIKMILFPLTYRSYLSTAKMRVLKPQIDEISKKYPKGKEMEKQQATMALYKKAGASPMGGCLPMLLQMPILIAMFRFFPASIELRQKGFLWVDDLSSYDSILELPFTIPMYGAHISLFPLLMAASMVVSTRMNASSQPTNANMPSMKMMMYIMPIFLLFIFNSYAAGLSYYYFLANVITILQTWIIRRFIIDEDTVLAKLEKNKKKPVKKSSWQKRLEKAARDRGYNPRKK